MGKKLIQTMKIHRYLINQKVIKNFLSFYFSPEKTIQFYLMDSCHICTLKTKQIRQVVKNLIYMINKITPFNIRSFKDHSQDNPFAKVLNNFLKGNMSNSQATLKCKHHTELKQKIIEYLDLDEGQILKRCQIILMSQIKTNYTLDTISLQMRLMPFRFPFEPEMLKQVKQSINKQMKSRLEKNGQSNNDQMGQMRKKRKDQQQNKKQIHYVNDKEQINIEAIQIETGKQLEENVSSDMNEQKERKLIQL